MKTKIPPDRHTQRSGGILLGEIPMLGLSTYMEATNTFTVLE